MSYFTTLDPEKRRKEYLELVMKLHPDKGGDIEEFKKMKNEYENGEFEKVEEGFQYSQNTENIFSSIIDKIIMFDIDIEICGYWIWLTRTKKSDMNLRNTLKTLKFVWHGQKKCWYYNHEQKRKKKSFSRGSFTMDDIRDKYGSSRVGKPKYKKVG